MQTTAPNLERDLPLPVRMELRSLRDDLTVGAITPAEYDALVDELLCSLGVPISEADD